ncbi:hypothetical protein FPANT_11478 [Fusarium pseudoanthophilum]|uniref:Uncharacterized protein n=1 Tax=Fusarium pseudoanthophilum TaxID=48495 RepID=A0A8H5KKV0_9HYPO|nr:hypothetical protein FPANT_11478 [Fusarium pseudoanthophilum]
MTALTLSNQHLAGSATESLATWHSLYECREIEAFHEGHGMKATLSRLKVLFDRVLSQVKAAEFLCDPHMLLYIWKRDVLVGAFLQSPRLRLRDLAFKGSDHLMVLVDSLFSILNSTPLDLKNSLGLGFWRYMRILGSQFGNDHFAVLNLGIYYNRTGGNIWGLGVDEDLQARYKHYLPVSNGSYRPSIATTSPEHQGVSMSDEQLGGLGCCTWFEREAAQGKLKYATVTRALTFALEQLDYDFHEKATTEALDLRKRKKIRKQRSAARKRVRLGLLRESDAGAAVIFFTNPDGIASIYRFMDEAIEIL